VVVRDTCHTSERVETALRRGESVGLCSWRVQKSRGNADWWKRRLVLKWNASTQTASVFGCRPYMKTMVPFLFSLRRSQFAADLE